MNKTSRPSSAQRLASPPPSARGKVWLSFWRSRTPTVLVLMLNAGLILGLYGVLKGGLDEHGRLLERLPANLPTPPVAAPEPRLLKLDKLDGLEKRLAALDRLAGIEKRLERLEEKQTPPPPIVVPSKREVEDWDVMVLAVNSKNLAITPYVRAFEEHFSSPKLREFANHRVGFYVAMGKRFDVRVDLKDPKIAAGAFFVKTPSLDATETLEELGPQLLQRFDPARPQRRCVVVASARCPAPSPAAAGWKELSVVDAVLIASDRQAADADPEELKKWAQLCGQKRGGLRLLVAETAGDQADSKTIDELKYHLHQLTSPRDKGK
jgi:hypothetical protein